jgi:trimeric autotransporter adhesin
MEQPRGIIVGAPAGMLRPVSERSRPGLVGACALALVALAAGAMLAAAVATTSPTVGSGLSAAPVRPGGAAGTVASLRGLPLTDQAVISRTLAAGDPTFALRRGSAGRLGVNAGGLQSSFSRNGVTVRSSGTRVSLAAPGGATLTTAGNRATYRNANLTESYVAGPLGLEQTLTISRRPRGPLQVTTALATSLRARLAAGVLTLSAGRDPVIRYGGLSATDATGRQLRAWMTLAPGNRLRIHVADAGARFPVRIDPFVQAAELSAVDGSAGDGFGDSVAISGSTVVAGAPDAEVGSNVDQGAAYVFTAAAGHWSNTMTATKLTESPGTGGDRFGISVAASGSVVVVGAYRVNSGAGAAYVFQEPNGGWASAPVAAPAVLTTSDDASGFGFAVATDGTMIAVGAQGTIESVKQPVVFVFTEPPSGGWISASGSTELVSSDPGTGLQGHALAVDGTTVVAGANSANDFEGAVYVFVRPPGGWSSTEPNDETATLTSADPVTNGNLGWSVAISGSTVAAGEPGANVSEGAVDVFQEPAGGWGMPSPTQTPNATLTAPAAASGQLGDSVGIETADAPATIVAGAPYATAGGHSGEGAVDVYQEGADGWTGATPKTLTAADGASGDGLGGADGSASGPLGIDGTTIVAGAPFHASEVGSAYVFQETTTSTTSTTSTTPPTPVPLRAAIKGRVRVKTGKKLPAVTSSVVCSGPAGESCRVTERLVVVEKVRAGKVIGVTARAKKRKPRTVKRTVVLAKSTVSIRVGGIRAFTLKLNGTGRRLLAKRHRLPTEFLAILTVGRRQTTFAQHSLTLKPPKKKKHKKHKR